MIELRTNSETALFDEKTGQIVSFTSRGSELLKTTPGDPVFSIEFLEEGRFTYLTSLQSSGIEYHIEGDVHCWTYRFACEIVVASRISQENDGISFSLEVENRTEKTICQVQYPWIIIPYGADGHVLQPYNLGYLFDDPQPQQLKPDCPRTWQFEERNGAFNHYTGRTFAQFLAYYDAGENGIIVMTQDGAGFVKQIMPVAAKNGVRLGFSHVGDWTEHRELEYKIFLKGFAGDWYDGAQVYRTWSNTQKWARRLCEHSTLPAWMADSPTLLMIRLQGALDMGPAQVNEGFLPYGRLAEKLENLNRKIPGSVLPILMAWEKGGPWVYPDCFPPAGGNEGMKEFAESRKKKGTHTGTYSNGTRWVTAHDWSGYDGSRYFEENDGSKSVCMTKDAQPWRQDWDENWRPSYTCCMHVPQTRDIAENYIKTMIENGIDWIQFLDQNNGCAVFPCFSKEHGHEGTPGRWMTQSLEILFDRMDVLKEEAKENEGREIVYSVEGPSNEYFIPRLDICDSRVNLRGNLNVEENQVPLYQFLYHEYILLNGGFGYGPEPYHMEIKNALNLVTGQIPGAVVMDDGGIQNQDTDNWAPWGKQPGSAEAGIQMLNTVNTIRRGAAKKYLVYGRMERPVSVLEIARERWQYGKRNNDQPAIFHSAWTAPDGSFAAVLANWTGQKQAVKVNDKRLISGLVTTVQGTHSEQHVYAEGVEIPAQGAVLIEQKERI